MDGGLYDELIRRSTRVLYGDAKETRLAPFLYMIDDVDAWGNITELAKANPNLGVSITVSYLLEEIRIAEGSLSKVGEVLTKYANIKQNSSQAWLPAKTVEAACGEELKLEDFRNSYCVAGIDLSQTRDLTACTAVIERNGELYVFAKFFLPAERIEEASQRDALPYNIYIQRGFLQPSGDNFIDWEGVTFTLTGARNGPVTVTEQDVQRITDFLATKSYSNFPVDRDYDDIYTLTAHVSDLAKNENEITITFSVNRFGSTWDYNKDKTTEKVVAAYYINREQPLVIREINPTR